MTPDQATPLTSAAAVDVRRLDSGYYHIRGNGPCEWAQPPYWPCLEEVLRAHAFPEASDAFIRAALQTVREVAE